jgi:hypothetical protein
MIGIRCHNPKSRFVHCRFRWTAMPVRNCIGPTVLDGRFPSLSPVRHTVRANEIAGQS